MIEEYTPTIVESSVPTVESLTRAEIDVAIATARRYPRSIEKFHKDALALATLNIDVAEACIYSKPQGNKILNGPSVRLAEIVALTFQHIRTGARVIEINRETMEIVVQGVCHDLENNTSTSVEYRRSIRTKDGRLYPEHMIQTNAAAACAIAYRMAVYRVIPNALIDPIYQAAHQVAVGDASTLSSRRDKALQSFLKMGIPPENVLARINKAGTEDITLDDLGVLIGLYNSIKSGENPVDECFPPVQQEDAVGGLVERLKEKKNGKLKEEKPESEPEPPEEQPEELTEKDGSPGPKKYVKHEKQKPDLDGKITEDQKVELQEIIHEYSIGKSAVSLILESHGAKLISELCGKDFISVKQALREVRK